MITLSIIVITTIISILGFRNRDIVYKLSMNPYSVVRRKEWYRLFTCSLVHADFTHLLVNMFVLWSFGGYLENQFTAFDQLGLIPNGSITYLFLYVSAVVVSSVPDMNKSKIDNALYNSIGASGGVSAILFASIFLSPWSNLYFYFFIPIPQIIFAAGYLWYSFYMDKRSQGRVNHKAHLAGAAYGMIFLTILNFDFAINFFTKLINFD